MDFRLPLQPPQSIPAHSKFEITRQEIIINIFGVKLFIKFWRIETHSLQTGAMESEWEYLGQMPNRLTTNLRPEKRTNRGFAT